MIIVACQCSLQCWVHIDHWVNYPADREAHPDPRTLLICQHGLMLPTAVWDVLAGTLQLSVSKWKIIAGLTPIQRSAKGNNLSECFDKQSKTNSTENGINCSVWRQRYTRLWPCSVRCPRQLREDVFSVLSFLTRGSLMDRKGCGGRLIKGAPSLLPTVYNSDG